MLTDEQLLDWGSSRKKMMAGTILCFSFEFACIISGLYWFVMIFLNPIPYNLHDILTTLIIVYVAYVPHFQQQTKLINIKEWVNVGFALLGAYMLYTIVIATEFTWVNLPLLIIYIWCIITYESYKYFNYWYKRWKRLDELFTIDILHQNILEVNRKIFNLDATEDKEEIDILKKYKEYVEKKLETLKDKHGR